MLINAILKHALGYCVILEVNLVCWSPLTLTTAFSIVLWYTRLTPWEVVRQIPCMHLCAPCGSINRVNPDVVYHNKYYNMVAAVHGHSLGHCQSGNLLRSWCPRSCCCGTAYKQRVKSSNHQHWRHRHHTANASQVDLKPKTTLKGKLHSIDDLRGGYPNQFDQIVNFPGEVKHLLKDDAEPFIDAPRKCSIQRKDKLRAELQSLVEQGVISKVEEHTDWRSRVAFSTKKDGSLRICLDQQRLNKSLWRWPHRIPIIEELNAAFCQSQGVQQNGRQDWILVCSPSWRVTTADHI